MGLLRKANNGVVEHNQPPLAPNVRCPRAQSTLNDPEDAAPEAEICTGTYTEVSIAFSRDLSENAGATILRAGGLLYHSYPAAGPYACFAGLAETKDRGHVCGEGSPAGPPAATCETVVGAP